MNLQLQKLFVILYLHLTAKVLLILSQLAGAALSKQGGSSAFGRQRRGKKRAGCGEVLVGERILGEAQEIGGQEIRRSGEGGRIGERRGKALS